MKKCIKFKLLFVIFICSITIVFSGCTSETGLIAVDNSFFSNNNHFSKSVFRDIGTIDSTWNNDNTFRTGMLYNNNEFFYVANASASSVEILNTEGEHRSVAYSSGEFTVYDNMLIFVCDGKIYKKELSSDKIVELTDGDSFKIYGDFLLTRINKNTIYKIGLIDNKREKVCSVNDDILWYSINDDRLYIIYSDVDLRLVIVDLINCKILSEYNLNINPANFIGIICDYNLIICNGNSVYSYDLLSGKQIDVFSCDGIISLNGEKQKLYFSVRQTYIDGSVTHLKESSDNGLWSYDITTKEKKKISENFYERLYVCSDDYLFAAKNIQVDFGFFLEKSLQTEFYQINLKTGEEMRVV